MVTFRLHGVECHVCGLPAEWFSDGVTMPCGCGRSRGEFRYQVKARIKAHEKACRKPTRPARLSAQAQAQHRAEKAAQKAWDTLAEVLVALKG